MNKASSIKMQVLFLCIGLLIFISYANTLNSPFNFDDHAVLQQVHLSGADGYSKIPPIKYRHLFFLSFSLNDSLSGQETFAFHLTNLFIHFLTSLLVFLIAFQTLNKGVHWQEKKAFNIAGITALLFALNPLHTETVTYLSGRASGMGGFFFLLAFLFFIFGSLKQTSKYFRLIFYLLSIGAFTASFLSKETTLTFPIVMVLYDFCFMKNENWASLKNRLLLFYLPLFLLAPLCLFLSTHMSSLIAEWLVKVDANYALSQAKIIGYALKLCLFPINLTFDYDFPAQWFPQSLSRFSAVAIWFALIFVILKNFQRTSPILIFSVFWFLTTISPTNSLLPRADLLSERNLYLPSIGPTLLIACTFHQLYFLKFQSRLFKQGVALIILLVVIQSSLLIKRNSIYQSNIALWEDTLKKSPSDLKVLHNLSHFYLEDKQFDKALVVLLRLSRSNASPFYRAFAHSNLGSIYAQNERFELAEIEFHKAIQLEPTHPLGHFNLGTYYTSLEWYKKARGEFIIAREMYKKFRWGYPMPPALNLNLGQVNLRLGLYSEAESDLKQYLLKKPNSSVGLFMLGMVYQNSGKTEQAANMYRSIKDDSQIQAKAHNNLGLIFLKQNQAGKAADEFQLALEFQPQSPDTHYNLGKLILDLNGDKNLAKKHLEAALAFSKNPLLEKEIKNLLNPINF